MSVETREAVMVESNGPDAGPYAFPIVIKYDKVRGGKIIMIKNNIKFVSALAGFFFGVIVAHPYVMLVYVFTNPGTGMKQAFSTDILNAVRQTFSPEMLPMAASFSFFCSVIGFLLGILYERNQKLSRLKFEMERRKAETDSMEKLLSILSHFILNSTMIIGAGVRQLKKADSALADSDVLKKIERQAEKNEEVLNLLREYEFLQYIQASDRSIEKILELTRCLEKRISR